MNPLEHRILEVLQASSDGHSTAFNVFNVLNRGFGGGPFVDRRNSLLGAIRDTASLGRIHLGLIRDLIRRGERQARKIEAFRTFKRGYDDYKKCVLEASITTTSLSYNDPFRG